MYDHHIKAGNPGDVIKHVALIAAANVLMRSCGGRFHYADTYSGYAYNPLRSAGEWRNGIGMIHDGKFVFCKEDVCFWRELWDCKYGLEGSVYPGSSVFIRKLCLKNGVTFQPRLWDVSPTAISQLMTAYCTQEAQIFSRPAILADFEGCTTNLLLVDPPDFDDIDKALSFFDLVDNVILWLPVTTVDGVETVTSSDAYQKCRDRGLAAFSVMWGGSKNTKGCRLVCQLAPQALQAIKYALLELVGAIEEWQIEVTAGQFG